MTKRVLVMERLDGFQFDDLERLKAENIDPHEIVRTGMVGFLEGAMVNGIFHGDLHGGNLFVRPDGKTALPRLWHRRPADRTQTSGLPETHDGVDE